MATRPWTLRYAPHLSFLTRDTPYFLASAGRADPLEQIAYIADLGFAGVADKDLKLRPAEEQTRIGEALSRLGLEMGGFVDQPEAPRSPWGSRDTDDVAFLRARLESSLEVARRVGGGHIGLTAIRDHRSPLGFQLANFIENLRWAAEMAEAAGAQLTVEAVSERRVPGQLLRYVADAHLVVTAVGSPALRLIFDCLHVQLQEGDLIANFQRARPSLGLLQISDNPGRFEPGSGEINFVNFLNIVRMSGYTGLVELEHFHSRPGREGEQTSLEALRRIDRQLGHYP